MGHSYLTRKRDHIQRKTRCRIFPRVWGNTFLLFHFFHWLFKNICLFLRRKRKTWLGSKSSKTPELQRFTHKSHLPTTVLKFLHLYLQNKAKQNKTQDWKVAPSTSLSELGFTHLPNEFSLSHFLHQISRETHAHTCKHTRCIDHCTYRFINNRTQVTTRYNK